MARNKEPIWRFSEEALRNELLARNSPTEREIISEAVLDSTSTELIERIFREEGVPHDEVTPPTGRPFVAEIPLSTLACVEEDAN